MYTVWCDKIGSQTHSNSANIIKHACYTDTKEVISYVVFAVIGFWFLYELYLFYLWARTAPQ